jgi:hypothetical protein
MPTLDEHPAINLAKILGVGDSGTAKSGSLASLALAGYKLKIADFDNGLDVLIGLLQDHPKWNQIKKNIEYETFTNEYEWADKDVKISMAQIKPTDVIKSKPKTVSAWNRGLAQIGRWTAEGPDTWLVVDSLSLLAIKCMENTQALTGSLGKNPTQPEWGNAMSDLENFLQLMSSKAVTCNTIMFAHKTYVEGDNGISIPYPRALGNKLPPKVPQYFNTMIGYIVSGSGDNVKRKIVTTPYQGLGFKTTAPTKVKNEYILDPKTPEHGLIDFVRNIGVELPK